MSTIYTEFCFVLYSVHYQWLNHELTVEFEIAYDRDNVATEVVCSEYANY